MVTKTQPITRELLHSKSLEKLREVYHTLSDKDGKELNRQQLEDYIFMEMALPSLKKVNTMTDKKTFTPGEIAKTNNIPVTSLRRLMRKIFKREKGSSWNLTKEDVAKLLQAYKEQKEAAAESRSHNIERLKAWREAHGITGKKPSKAEQAKAEAEKAAPAKKKPVAK